MVMRTHGRKRTVLVFGTFDILHPGHLAFLNFAKHHGATLVVVVARDATVRHYKKRPPYMSQEDRLSLVASLAVVDRALLGDNVGQWRVIRKVRPDIICIGHDQSKDHPGLHAQLHYLKKKPLILKAPAYRRIKYRSSSIRTCCHGHHKKSHI